MMLLHGVSNEKELQSIGIPNLPARVVFKICNVPIDLSVCSAYYNSLDEPAFISRTIFGGAFLSEEQAGKLPRRERERLRYREEILDAALELFSESGYHNVSMQEIADKAEFAVGTLYNFFDNKRDLYKALMLSKALTFNKALSGPLQNEKDPLEAIEEYISVRWSLFTTNLSVWRLYFAETQGASFNFKSGLDADLLELYDQLMEKLVSVFDSGVQKKTFRDLDTYHMAIALEGTITAFLFRVLQKPELVNSSDGLSGVTEIFLHGVLNE
jgi:TetR/AcrR family transcriptional regulator